MTSPRKTACAVLVALAALLGCLTGPAAAATPKGVGGYVIDADTGLPLDQAVLTWQSDVTPAPTLTTGPTGRYAFSGLDAGSVGRLVADGPAGWQHTTLENVTIPADEPLNQDIALHRDWATPASGGAITAANDSSGDAAGCGAGAAVDNNRATGWSAAAGRPASDAPSITVQLGQTVDVGQFVLDPTSACSHPAGAALGRFRVETSGDGASWATALESDLGPDALGKATAFTPTGGASGVRFVRLTLLSAQDPAATTIDLRELQVFGAGPNQPPSGTVTSDSFRNYINGAVRFNASFSDPDSSIVRYLWDFNADGTWDQATQAPSVAHVWQGVGNYHVIVGARDFRGALGTSDIELRVTDPEQPIEPIIQRKPLITFDVVDGIDLPLRIACASQCRMQARMVLSPLMARRLHLKHRTILTMNRKTEGPGIGSWFLELPGKTITKLHRAGRSKVNVQITVVVTDQQKRRSTVHRWFTFR